MRDYTRIIAWGRDDSSDLCMCLCKSDHILGNYGPGTKSESAVCFNGKTREYFAEFSL